MQGLIKDVIMLAGLLLMHETDLQRWVLPTCRPTELNLKHYEKIEGPNLSLNCTLSKP